MENERFVFIDLYDQVVNNEVVDMGFAYDSWPGQYVEDDYDKKLFQLKVRGYFDEE